MTFLRCRPDNPGAWLAVTAIARLAARVGKRKLVLPTWQQDGAMIALSPKQIAAIIGDCKEIYPVAPWDDAGPVIMEVRGQLICLDWHCRPERKLTSGPQLRLLSGQVTLTRHIAACTQMITHDRLLSAIIDDEAKTATWLDGAPDEGVWLFDAAGAWQRGDLGYSADALGVAVAGNAVIELLAMIGCALTTLWSLQDGHFRYAIDDQEMWAPFIARGRLRALGWARPHQDQEDDL